VPQSLGYYWRWTYNKLPLVLDGRFVITGFFCHLSPLARYCMSNTLKHRIIQKIFQQQRKPTTGRTADAGVGQDKTALTRERAASSQVAPRPDMLRSDFLNNRSQRTTPINRGKKRTVELSLWVDPVVKDEIARRAKRNGLSISATGGALLRRALQQSIDMEYGALLEPIIREDLRRQMRTYSSRIALLLVRVAFSAEQTRALVTNILDRQPGVDPDILNTLLDHSANAAKRKITAKTPQLLHIIAEVESWFTEREETEGGK